MPPRGEQGAGGFAEAATHVETPRLLLHPIDEAEGQRILSGLPGSTDVWAEDFPFRADLLAVTVFLECTALWGEQRPFGYYRVSRAADGRAIGGIGFKGRPEGGCVEVGFGLAESARGCGYAAEALRGLLGVAADHAVSRVVADTTRSNVASRRTLERAGFHRWGTDGDVDLYEVLLPAPRLALNRPPTEPVGHVSGVNSEKSAAASGTSATGR